MPIRHSDRERLAPKTLGTQKRLPAWPTTHFFLWGGDPWHSTGERLRDLRVWKGMSTRQAGAGAKISAPAWSKWESGKTTLCTGQILKAARALGVSFADITLPDGHRDIIRDRSLAGCMCTWCHCRPM